jgi:ribosome maturation factor RimP
MDRHSLVTGWEGIIGEYLRNQQIELVELSHRYEGSDLVLRLLVDRPEGGITIGECASLNSEISRIIEAENLLPGRYVLEVSSPGLDRPLRTRSDFARCLERRVRVFLSAPINGRLEWEGVISRVGEESVSLDIAGTPLEIPLVKINKGKQVV